jgi:hypothetical protein
VNINPMNIVSRHRNTMAVTMSPALMFSVAYPGGRSIIKGGIVMFGISGRILAMECMHVFSLHAMVAQQQRPLMYHGTATIQPCLWSAEPRLIHV